jgi:hypothetical protein
MWVKLEAAVWIESVSILQDQLKHRQLNGSMSFPCKFHSRYDFMALIPHSLSGQQGFV